MSRECSYQRIDIPERDAAETKKSYFTKRGIAAAAGALALLSLLALFVVFVTVDDSAKEGDGNASFGSVLGDWVTSVFRWFVRGDKDAGSGTVEASKIEHSKDVWVFTTASLPWITNTATNPVLRAAYLLKELGAHAQVTLVLPWVAPVGHQRMLFGDLQFSNAKEQEEEVRRWLSQEGSMPDQARSLRVKFYPATFIPEMVAVFPAVNLLDLVDSANPDVAILEEPEHINWLMAADSMWRDKFKHVVGIVHFSYNAYFTSQMSQKFISPVVREFNRMEVEANCDVVIKLSNNIQKFSEKKDVTENVNGVRRVFLSVGDMISANPETAFTQGLYYIGRVTQTAGFDSLNSLSQAYANVLNEQLAIDIYGTGSDVDRVTNTAAKLGLSKLRFMKFFPDHTALRHYKTLVYVGEADVLSSEIAEALAMNKFVILKDHPANEFYKKFPNALFYTSPVEFIAQVEFSKTHMPTPLASTLRGELSWEQATQRLFKAATITQSMNDRGSPTFRAVLQSFMTEYVKPHLSSYVVGDAPIPVDLNLQTVTPPSLTRRTWDAVKEHVAWLWQWMVASESNTQTQTNVANTVQPNTLPAPVVPQQSTSVPSLSLPSELQSPAPFPQASKPAAEDNDEFFDAKEEFESELDGKIAEQEFLMRYFDSI